jgi:DNA (cytosine-5)-methyltransferase 1
VSRPKLLDLFCGAGGCSVGYQRAGFDVVGVDNKPHPDYPFPMVVADAMEFLAVPTFLAGFDAVHASPPCPRYSVSTPSANRDSHPDLVEPTRIALRSWGGVYVIENVPGAPLDNPTLYCGAAFSLGSRCRDGRYRQLKRHRLFESNALLMSPGCGCDAKSKVGVYGDGGGGQSTRPSGGGGYKAYPEEAREAMAIDWMRRDDLADAIPPAYTEHIGAQLLDQLTEAAA